IDGAACGCGLWRQCRARHPGPLTCAVCGRGLPAVSDLSSRTPPRPAIRSSKPPAPSQRGQEALPAQSKPGRAAGCSRKLAPSPVVTLGPSEQLSVCLQWHSLGTCRGTVSATGAASSGGPTCYKCVCCGHQRMSTPGQVASHISRFSHENFASLVDDCSRLADGPPPGQELPYLRVRLCPMRPVRVTPGSAHPLAEESAAADMASRSLQLAVARQNLGLPYSVNLCLLLSAVVPADHLCTSPACSALLGLRFASDLPPHLNAAHRRPCPLCQKPILLPDVRPACAGICRLCCITRALTVRRAVSLAKPSCAASRRRPFDHNAAAACQTTTASLDCRFCAAATQNARHRRDDRLLLCFTLWRRIHQLVGAEVASFGAAPASSWQFCNKLFNFLLFVLGAADWLCSGRPSPTPRSAAPAPPRRSLRRFRRTSSSAKVSAASLEQQGLSLIG
uniref:Zf-C2H2_12 domain-containing protein n=1 Tax=Macrostomum lignano TaxID=282301 RepID=A0A1I8FPW3_9PLAT